MTSSFTDLGNIGTGKSNGIDANNINEARRQFQNGTINAATPKPREPSYALGLYLDKRAANAALYWPEINPSYEEELHHEAA